VKQEVEIVYALHRTPRQQNAPVADSRGSRIERRRAPSAAIGKSPDEPPQARPEAQSPSPTISDEKLNAAAVAIGRVTTIRESYERKIAEAPPSDKERITDEANNALKKAVTDQGLSVDEYNSIIKTAQNDPAVLQKLEQRIPHSGQ
jgi:predicted ATPase with chaperone activity